MAFSSSGYRFIFMISRNRNGAEEVGVPQGVTGPRINGRPSTPSPPGDEILNTAPTGAGRGDFLVPPGTRV